MAGGWGQGGGAEGEGQGEQEARERRLGERAQGRGPRAQESATHGDALDVVAQHLAVALGAALAQTLATLATARHFGGCESLQICRAQHSELKFRNSK